MTKLLCTNIQLNTITATMHIYNIPPEIMETICKNLEWQDIINLDLALGNTVVSMIPQNMKGAILDEIPDLIIEGKYIDKEIEILEDSIDYDHYLKCLYKKIEYEIDDLVEKREEIDDCLEKLLSWKYHEKFMSWRYNAMK